MLSQIHTWQEHSVHYPKQAERVFPLQAARAEAEEVLGNASSAARMGGGAEQRWNDTSFRGDCTCWLSHAGNPPALQAAVDALLMLQPGDACMQMHALRHRGFSCTVLHTLSSSCSTGC